MTLLKIVFHCNEVVVGSVSGTLLGCLSATKLEITDCYRTKTNDSDYRKFYLNMQECLGQIGIENYMVGWYSRAFYNEFLYTKRVASDCFINQENIPFSICLIYDPNGFLYGRLAIKAFRLCPKMQELFREYPECTMDNLIQNQISINDMFEEIPIEIQNHILVHSFLFDIKNLTNKFLGHEDMSSIIYENNILDLISRLGSTINRFCNNQVSLKTYWHELKLWHIERESHWKLNLNIKREQAYIDFEKKNSQPKNNDRLDSFLIIKQLYDLTELFFKTVSNEFFKIWISKGV